MTPKYAWGYILKIGSTSKKLLGGALSLGSPYWRAQALVRPTYRSVGLHLACGGVYYGPLTELYAIVTILRSEIIVRVEPIRNVTVKLMRIEPEVENMNWLPMNLHLKHDNAPPGAVGFVNAREFDLHSGDVPQHVDLVAAAVGTATITVEHITQGGVNKSIPSDSMQQMPSKQKLFSKCGWIPIESYAVCRFRSDNA